jgi:hypothetical protein
LEGDGGQRFAFALNLDAFLGLDGLVQAVRIPPPRHKPPGKLVHNDDFVVLYHIVHVALHVVIGF